MLRPIRVLAVLTTAAGLVVGGSLIDAANAACGATSSCDDGPSTSGSTVSVRVSGTLTAKGQAGSTGSTVYVPVPCYRIPLYTGKSYFDGVKDGTINGAGSKEAENGTWKPNAGYRKHKHDTKGHWYVRTCSSELFGDDYDAFDKFSTKFFDEQVDAYVEPGQEPPAPPVPAELLLQAAEKAMVIPQPRFDENPHIAGEHATLVSLPTWFWQEQGVRKSGYITASAGDNSATVTMNLDDITFDSPRAGSVTCPNGGVAFTPGAASDCTLVFSAAAEAAPVTATSHWAGSWTFNDEPRGDVDPVTGTWQDEMRVSEVQALVTGVG